MNISTTRLNLYKVELTISSHELQEVVNLSQGLHGLQGGQPTLSHQRIHTGVILHGPPPKKNTENAVSQTGPLL